MTAEHARRAFMYSDVIIYKGIIYEMYKYIPVIYICKIIIFNNQLMYEKCEKGINWSNKDYIFLEIYLYCKM